MARHKAQKSYTFPESLKLLELYLSQKGEDVSALKSDRHALSLLIFHTKIKVPFPKHGHVCYQSLRKLHVQLFPRVALPTAKYSRSIKGTGTVGPASPVRAVSPETFQEIVERTRHENESALQSQKESRAA